MTDEGKTQAAATELELAGEELRAAEQLLGSGLARIALARIYFAVFHAARAHLFAAGLEPRSHGGVLHLWNLHAVRGGDFDAASSRLLARLQKYRQEADYAHAFVVDADGARQELEAARVLVESVRRGLAPPD